MARPSTGANLNIAQLEQILSHRKSELTRLEKQKKDLLKKLGDIDANIAKIGGSPGGARRERAPTTTRACPKHSTTSFAPPAAP